MSWRKAVWKLARLAPAAALSCTVNTPLTRLSVALVMPVGKAPKLKTSSALALLNVMLACLSVALSTSATVMLGKTASAAAFSV